jgi:predicted DNA-binding transcriptional regulator AlpA
MASKLRRELLVGRSTLDIGSADRGGMNSPSRLIRFRDLRERNVVTNWPTLLRLIQREKFPPGMRLGAQTRAWREDEVEGWLDSRRIPSPAE